MAQRDVAADRENFWMRRERSDEALQRRAVEPRRLTKIDERQSKRRRAADLWRRQSSAPGRSRRVLERRDNRQRNQRDRRIGVVGPTFALREKREESADRGE